MTAALQIKPDSAIALPADLESLEEIIADHLRSFVEVGRALAAIRDGGLYEVEGFRTFEKYCRAKWEMGRNYANKLIGSAEVVANVGYHGTQTLPPVTVERQARELARIKEPEAQAAAWAEAVATAPAGVVTAKHVAAVVVELHPELAKPKRVAMAPAAPPAPSKPAPEPCGPVTPMYAAVPGSAFDVLEALRAQRNGEPEFAAWVDTRRTMAKSMPSKEARMLVFILDGGEVALARLGLDWNATPEALKKAYWKACETEHPDKGGSADRFRAVTNAYGLVKEYLS